MQPGILLLFASHC